MPEDLKQKLSLLLDDELDHQQALSLLKKMQSQPELQRTLQRYEAVSHALKTEAFLLTHADFSKKIHQQIQQEPSYLLPKQKSISRFTRYQPFAIAASVAIVAVLAGHNLIIRQPSTQASTPLQVAQQPITQTVSPLQIAQQQADKSTTDKNQDPLNKRINDYLQAHNNSVYTNGETTLQPYARVTTYSQK